MKNVVLAFGLLIMTTAVLAQSKVPSVKLKNLEGSTIDTGALENDGKPIVISFWATWCSPCKRELNTYAEHYDDWVDETGVKIVAVSIDDQRSMTRVAPYINSVEWDYDFLMDPNKDFMRAMNVINCPHTFLINGEGVIVWQHNNYSDGDEEELYEQLLKL